MDNENNPQEDDYMHFLNLCTDELKPLTDEQLKIVAKALTPGITLEEFFKLSRPHIASAWPSNAHIESGLMGQLVSSAAHVSALAPRLLATINALRPELGLSEISQAGVDKARKQLKAIPDSDEASEPPIGPA